MLIFLLHVLATSWLSTAVLQTIPKRNGLKQLLYYVMILFIDRDQLGGSLASHDIEYSHVGVGFNWDFQDG